MNIYWVLAFVITPAIVLLIEYVGVLLHERSLDKNRPTPGE